MKQLNGVYPISGEDLSALPVKAIGPAVAFYRDVLRFTVVSQDEERAVVQRDDAVTEPSPMMRQEKARPPAEREREQRPEQPAAQPSAPA